MCKGIFGIAALTGLFVTVFVGALTYKLVKRTGIDEVSDSAGYRSDGQGVAGRGPVTGQPVLESA